MREAAILENSPNWMFQRFVLFAVLVLGCRDGTGTFTPKPDMGMGNTTCANTSDCGGTGICVAGLCQEIRSCTSDDECSADGKVCHANRFYCVECDGTHPDECAQGSTCQFDFTCVPIGGGTDAGVTDGAVSECSGGCMDRSECGPDQVCKEGACCPPPPRCFSPEDCPTNSPQCNGATGACFGGQSCLDDNDCDNMGGCAPGTCRCDGMNGQPGSCVLRENECDEDVDCTEQGDFCARQQNPRLCLRAPLCTGDAQCANQGLVCDTGLGHCVNGAPCPMGTECTPTQTCVGGSCVGSTCVTNPSICMPGETCDQATGSCIPMQGGNCTLDAECQPGFYCDTMVNPGVCRTGCRDNNDCSGGVCDAAHTCQFPTGGLCGACTTDMDCPAGSICGMLSGQCVEQCNMITGQMCSDATRECIFFVCPCFP